jgi:hypothetical protein
MRLMKTRAILWAIGMSLGAAAPVPAQMTAAQDHQRMMDALHIATNGYFLLGLRLRHFG